VSEWPAPERCGCVEMADNHTSAPTPQHVDMPLDGCAGSAGVDESGEMQVHSDKDKHNRAGPAGEESRKRRRIVAPPQAPSLAVPGVGVGVGAWFEASSTLEREEHNDHDAPSSGSRRAPPHVHNKSDGVDVNITEEQGARTAVAARTTTLGRVPDWYGVLGAAESSTTEQLNAEFRERALILHPDRNQSDPLASDRFRALNEA
jgi:hypothetical protein